MSQFLKITIKLSGSVAWNGNTSEPFERDVEVDVTVDDDRLGSEFLEAITENIKSDLGNKLQCAMDVAAS